jgi:putative heme-binding domain-containing protein
LRAEALATLGVWPNPSVVDRVDGYYRGEVSRDAAIVQAKVKAVAAEFLNDQDAGVLMATSTMLKNLKIPDFNSALAQLARLNKNADVRSAVLKDLQSLNYADMGAIIKTAMVDKDEKVRTTAISLMASLKIADENLAAIVKPIFENGSVAEQQQLLQALSKMKSPAVEGILTNVLDRLMAQKISSGITLELLEAIDSTQSQSLIAKAKTLRGSESDQYAGTLLGGDRRAGANYFYWNQSAQCVRCHSMNDEGSKVGPNLSDIGNLLSREQILDALVNPSARLSPGFGTVKVTLTDGHDVTGILMHENEKEIELKTSEAEPLKIAVTRISKRQNFPSGMPPMGSVMSKKEIRDVIEFLANQKQN